MNVIFIAPGYPPEMPLFVRGLALHGAQVYGVSDVPMDQLPPMARQYLSGYLRVDSLADEMSVVGAVTKWMTGKSVDRVACMWEPGVVLAARMREAMGVPGMEIEQATRFRDKDLMKQSIHAAGIRAARHARASTVKQVWKAVEQVGYPAIVKPIPMSPAVDSVSLKTSTAPTAHIAFCDALITFARLMVRYRMACVMA